MNITEITIRRTGDHVEVIQGDKTTGQLCMGECIEQVIGLIFPEHRKVYPMLTEKEREDRLVKARQRAKEATQAREADVPAMTVITLDKWPSACMRPLGSEEAK